MQYSGCRHLVKSSSAVITACQCRCRHVTETTAQPLETAIASIRNPQVHWQHFPRIWSGSRHAKSRCVTIRRNSPCHGLPILGGHRRLIRLIFPVAPEMWHPKCRFGDFPVTSTNYCSATSNACLYANKLPDASANSGCGVWGARHRAIRSHL